MDHGNHAIHSHCRAYWHEFSEWFRAFSSAQAASEAVRGLNATGLAVALVLLAASTFCFAVEPPDAGSWFLDAARHHVSAHGQISCQDCHPNVIRRTAHPDPAQVNRSLRDFFSAETCYGCHDGTIIKKNLEMGLHAGKPIKKAEDYSHCIACHDPHYQPRLSKKGASETKPVVQTRELCSTCHDQKQKLPEAVGDDVKCLECHKASDPQDSERARNIDRICLGCHGQAAATTKASVTVPWIDKGKHIFKGHSGLDCLSCHREAARFEHHRQSSPNCRQCHTPHRESIIHDAHTKVSCQACHLDQIEVSRDPGTRKVVWQRSEKTSQASWLNVVRPGEGTGSCQRCHHAGNHVGAAAMVLPAKSLICMPCHAATFSARDPISVLALVGFGLGMCVVASVWFTGTLRPRAGSIAGADRGIKAAFSARAAAVLKALFLDGLFQRKLFIQSRLRWMIHALIFLPFVVRFVWGLAALVGSLAWPSQAWVWQMLDKNWFLTAFVFDLTGLMVILGVILAILRRHFSRDEVVIDGLPERDWLAVGLLGGIVLVGFLLEGARLAMTGPAEGARWAFVGWALSFAWRGTAGLNEIYGYVWYLHAFLTGAFLLYLPFSGMVHVVMAPLVSVLNAADRFHGHRGSSRHGKNHGSGHR
ncbi:MAG: cytochrome c3 family protein [Desulfomonile tiedjei]|nr:cytochrome c3 family protein [Desulfomonile tiedjei]